MIEEADRDNSGAIDFREFCSLMVKREREKETTEDIKQAFRVFDKVDALKLIQFPVLNYSRMEMGTFLLLSSNL